ncbi:MAG: zinc metalloprotease HtpX [Nitrospirota bacterium]
MNTLKTTFLMAALTVLLVFAGQLLGGRGGAQFAFIMALVMNVGAYWFSDRIVLKMYGAKECRESDAPELYSIVRSLAARDRLPMPRVYIINKPTPNAFATGRNPEHGVVAVTTGIITLLNREELEGVIAHELSHIKNRDILIGTIAATIAGAISYMASMAQWALIFGGFRGDNDDDSPMGGIGGLLIMILAPIAAMVIQMAISRSREYLADQSGGRLCGNPLSLANALRKLHTGAQRTPMVDANPSTAHMFIVNPLRGGGMANLFSTHPPIEERISRLMAMSHR